MNENNQPQSQQQPSESALDKAPTRAPREDTTTFEERGLMESKRQRFNERLNQVMNGKPDEQSKAHERIKALEKKCHDYAIAQEGNLAKLDELNAKQAELVAENQKLREYITAEREISQRFTDENAKLRSERDRLKSDCDAWKGMIVPILDFAQQHGKQLGIRPGESIPKKVLEILKSALSGGSKQVKL